MCFVMLYMLQNIQVDPGGAAARGGASYICVDVRCGASALALVDWCFCYYVCAPRHLKVPCAPK